MNYTQKALLAILGIFLFLAAFILVIYIPSSNRLESLRAESKRLDGQWQEIRLKEAQLPQIQSQVGLIEEKLAQIEEQYPRSIESVYRFLTEVAQKYRIQIVNMEATEKKEQPDPDVVRLWNIDISGNALYDDLGEFLGAVTHLPVLITISGLHLESMGGTKTQDSIEVSLGLTAYLSPEPENGNGKE